MREHLHNPAGQPSQNFFGKMRDSSARTEFDVPGSTLTGIRARGWQADMAPSQTFVCQMVVQGIKEWSVPASQIPSNPERPLGMETYVHYPDHGPIRFVRNIRPDSFRYVSESGSPTYVRPQDYIYTGRIVRSRGQKSGLHLPGDSHDPHDLPESVLPVPEPGQWDEFNFSRSKQYPVICNQHFNQFLIQSHRPIIDDFRAGGGAIPDEDSDTSYGRRGDIVSCIWDWQAGAFVVLSPIMRRYGRIIQGMHPHDPRTKTSSARTSLGNVHANEAERVPLVQIYGPTWSGDLVPSNIFVLAGPFYAGEPHLNYITDDTKAIIRHRDVRCLLIGHDVVLDWIDGQWWITDVFRSAKIIRYMAGGGSNSEATFEASLVGPNDSAPDPISGSLGSWFHGRRPMINSCNEDGEDTVTLQIGNPHNPNCSEELDRTRAFDVTGPVRGWAVYDDITDAYWAITAECQCNCPDDSSSSSSSRSQSESSVSSQSSQSESSSSSSGDGNESSSSSQSGCDCCPGIASFTATINIDVDTGLGCTSRTITAAMSKQNDCSYEGNLIGVGISVTGTATFTFNCDGTSGIFSASGTIEGNVWTPNTLVTFSTPCTLGSSNLPRNIDPMPPCTNSVLASLA